MASSNNVSRMLDVQKIRYSLFEIPTEKMSALEVCAFLHKPPEKVFKTIVLHRDKNKKNILALVPATSEVSAKKLAKFLNEKKVSVTTQNDAERITGLLAGGISPLALINKGFQVVVDESAIIQENIIISGGQRGLQVEIAPKDLITLTNARTAHISE